MKYLRTHWTRTLSTLMNHRRILHRLPESESPKLSLVIEDGPTRVGTVGLLDVLEYFQIPATFMLVGRQAVQHQSLVKEIIDRGHDLGNHTFSHRPLWPLCGPKTVKELQHCEEALGELTNSRVRWISPPYGQVSKMWLNWANRYEKVTVLGDVVLPDDQPGIDEYQLKMYLKRHLRPGSILRLHDNQASHANTASLLVKVIPELLDEGWEFQRLPAAA